MALLPQHFALASAQNSPFCLYVLSSGLRPQVVGALLLTGISKQVFACLPANEAWEYCSYGSMAKLSQQNARLECMVHAHELSLALSPLALARFLLPPSYRPFKLTP